MKLLPLIFSFLLFSCGGDDEGIHPHRQFDYGSITAFKNGVSWSAEIHGVDNDSQWDYFGVDIRIYNDQGFEREGLIFSYLPKSESNGILIETCGVNCFEPYQSSFITSTADGDVNCDVYQIVEELSNENWIEITEYNYDTKEFRGTFRATFAIDEDRTRCDPNAPDTIRFTNGQFYSKITR